MIDIHSHVLPNIDDGPTSWKETMDMLQMAIDDGIKEVAITHHILSNVDYEREPEILAKFDELRMNLAKAKMGIKVHLAAEIYAQADMELHHTISTYNNNKKFFLVEFPMQGIPRYAAERFFEIVTQGMVPIIAHPERNMGVVRNPERAYEFVQRGALLQMNAGSILGRHGPQVRETAMILLNSDLIHFVGSDGHNTRNRPLRLSAAWDAVAEGWGVERAQRLFVENPRQAIAGGKVVAPEPLPVQPLETGWVRSIKRLKKIFT